MKNLKYEYSYDKCHGLICDQHKNVKHQMARNFGMVASRVEDTKNDENEDKYALSASGNP